MTLALMTLMMLTTMMMMMLMEMQWGFSAESINRFLSRISSGSRKDKFAKDCQKLGRPKVRKIALPCFSATFE